MAEKGIVIKEKGKYVTVKLERKEACAHCRACTAGLESKDMIIEAENVCNAKQGDIVNISLEEINFIQAVFIMYTIPLISLLIGLGIGYLVSDIFNLSNTELIAFGFGLLLLAVSYFIIRLNEDKFKTKKFRPIANNIVETKQ